MAGIGDGLSFDPALNYYGQTGQRPRFINSGDLPGIDADAGANGSASPHTPNPNLADDSPENIRVRAAINRARTSFGQTAGIGQVAPPLSAPAGSPTSPDGIGDGAADAAGAAAQSEGIGSRMAEAVGTKFSPATRAVGRVVGRTALGIGGTLIRNAGPIGDIAYEGMQAAPTLLDPRATGYDKAAAVSKGIGRGMATLAGAGIGAAAGSAIPVVGTVLGGIGGGIAGYFGGDKAIQWGRHLLGTQPYETPGVVDQAIAAGRVANAVPQRPVAAPAPAVSSGTSDVVAATPQAIGSRIFQNPDGSYIDSPGAGATRFTQTRGGYGASGAPLDADASRNRILAAGRMADRATQTEDEQRGEQQQQIGSAINVAQDYTRRQDAENRARSGQVALHFAQWRGDGKDQINAIRGQIAHDQQDASTSLPSTPAGMTPEQAAALGATHQKQDIENQGVDAQQGLVQQQGIAAGMENQQRRTQLDAVSKLDQLGPNTDASKRRALIDRALVSRGEDPDKGRYMEVTGMGPDGMTPLKEALDTRSGQIIGGNAGVGQKPSVEQFLAAAKADPRNKGQSDDQLKAYYKQKYGQ